MWPAARMMLVLACAIVLLFAPLCALTKSEEHREKHVVVTYQGIGEDHAKAIARTIETAREECATVYGFDMPNIVRVNVTVHPQQAVRLFNDGVDTLSLTIRSEADLRKPTSSGVYHIYGLCHELSHLAMYRPIKDHSWLSTGGAEGWAHYLGSELVDKVYAHEGPMLWPDRYDYRADGMRRLKAQFEQSSSSDTIRGAQRWHEFVELIGAKKTPGVFQAWGETKIDPADPAKDLKTSLAKVVSDRQLDSWWERAEGTLLVKRPNSTYPLKRLKPNQLIGASRELAFDDDKPAGKSSIAGGGHAVRFRVSDDSWYVTKIEVHGSRYGARTPPKEKFRLWLCDAKFNSIASYEFDYGQFELAKPNWVALTTEPTNVPAEFIVCVGFNPAATKGVFVSHDGKRDGESLTGLPGKEPANFARGDWLIRVHVDQSKDVDALAPMVPKQIVA
jgi:hypothetical protein